MQWPSVEEYDAWLDEASTRFTAQQLQQARFEQTDDGTRWRHVGQSAAVYRVYRSGSTNGAGSALRLLISKRGREPVAAGRAPLIQASMQRALAEPAARILATNHEFLPGELKGDQAQYPVILHDWIDGQALWDWQAARCKEGDQEAFAGALTRFVQFLQNLVALGLVHAQLKPAHLIIDADSQFRLVDYDCLADLTDVAGLTGVHLIHKNPYQHPDVASGADALARLDVFPACRILADLKALSLDPSLWGPRAVSELPLIRNQDIEEAGTSPIFTSLEPLGDKTWEGLRDLLQEYYDSSLSRLPTLAEFASHVADLLGVPHDPLPPVPGSHSTGQDPQPPPIVEEQPPSQPVAATMTAGPRWGASTPQQTTGSQLPDAGTPDIGMPTSGTGTPNTGTPNTGTPNTGTPNTGTPNTGTPNTGTPNVAAAVPARADDQLLAAIRADDKRATLATFKITEARKQGYTPQEQAEILAGLQRLLRSPQALGLANAYPNAGLLNCGGGRYELDWVWPNVELVDKCHVAVCQEKPEADDTPNTIDTLYDKIIHYMGREQAELTAKNEHANCYVAVWAVFDFDGSEKVYSEPLVMEQKIQSTR